MAQYDPEDSLNSSADGYHAERPGEDGEEFQENEHLQDATTKTEIY
jgi:hypothetical protein